MIGNNDNWNSLPPFVRGLIYAGATGLAGGVLWFFCSCAGIIDAITK